MVGDFDTYFLESDSITGPWRLANYNARFGSEAYFCNWPSKFLAKQANTTQRVYDGFLAYSANFARGISNPPHSGYHLNLQQSRFNITQKLLKSTAFLLAVRKLCCENVLFVDRLAKLFFGIVLCVNLIS